MEIKEEPIKELLSEVNAIRNKWHEEFDKTGERFNVFEIIGLTSNETRTHSAFIGELLNPNALHGEGSKFLELFLEEIKFNGLDTNSARVEIEKHIGPIPKDYEYGGRVDLFITDNKNNSLLIENKIYAGDQHKQLYRYYKHCKETKKSNFTIIYLNLNGTPPSSHSIEGSDYKLESGKDFKVMSYKKNIIDWLNKCSLSISDKPIVKEAINHYITLIKNLTGQSITKNMENEISTLLLNNIDNFKTARAIKDLYDKTKQVIYNKFWDEIKQQGNLNIEIDWKKEYRINFQIDEDNDGFYFSFSAKKLNGERIDNNASEFSPLIDIVRKIDNRFKNNESNIGWKYPNNLRRFFELSDDNLFKLSSDSDRKTYVEELLNEGKQYWKLFVEEIKLLA